MSQACKLEPPSCRQYLQTIPMLWVGRSDRPDLYPVTDNFPWEISDTQCQMASVAFHKINQAE